MKCWYLQAFPDNVASLPLTHTPRERKGPSRLDVDMDEKGHRCVERELN